VYVWRYASFNVVRVWLENAIHASFREFWGVKIGGKHKHLIVLFFQKYNNLGLMPNELNSVKIDSADWSSWAKFWVANKKKTCWRAAWRRRLDHPRQILCQSVHGFRSSNTPNFPFSMGLSDRRYNSVSDAELSTVIFFATVSSDRICGIRIISLRMQAETVLGLISS